MTDRQMKLLLAATLFAGRRVEAQICESQQSGTGDFPTFEEALEWAEQILDGRAARPPQTHQPELAIGNGR